MSRCQTMDCAEVYYKDWGSGRPVLFSHGWQVNADLLAFCEQERPASLKESAA